MPSTGKSCGRLSGFRPKVPLMKQKLGQMMCVICDLGFDSLKYRYGLEVSILLYKALCIFVSRSFFLVCLKGCDASCENELFLSLMRARCPDATQPGLSNVIWGLSAIEYRDMCLGHEIKPPTKHSLNFKCYRR